MVRVSSQSRNEFYIRLLLMLFLTIGILLVSLESLKQLLDIESVVYHFHQHLIDVYEYLESAVFHIHIIPSDISSKIFGLFGIHITKGYAAFKIPVSILDFCGSILVCQSHRINSTKRPWFKSLVECTLMQFGGTTLTGLLLGQTPSWILSKNAFPALFLAWYLTYFCPYDIYYTFISSAVGIPILFIANIGAAVSSGHAVTSWGLDKAAFNAFHKNSHKISGSFLTCLGCGTLSACGGGLLTTYFDFFGYKGDFKLNTLNRSFWLALIYYCMLNKNKDLPWDITYSKEVGHATIINFQLLNLLIVSLNRDLDIFERFSNLVCRVLNIHSYISPKKHEKNH
jgi:hypothetical protein